METKFREIRRRDRVLDEARALELLYEGEYGVLSVGAGVDGYGYGVPLNFAFDPATRTIHFHCAPEGHKLDNLRLNNCASFCVVGRTEPQGDKFTTIYESVIAFGRVRLAREDDERRESLRHLIKKYSAGHEAKGETYMERSLPRTQTFTLYIERITAKCKKQ